MELLEREDHLAMLDARLAEVPAGGRGRWALLAGEAGVGKTALVRGFGERHRSGTVLAGAWRGATTQRSCLARVVARTICGRARASFRAWAHRAPRRPKRRDRRKLFLSEKTVEHQVSTILHKLGGVARAVGTERRSSAAGG